MKKRAYKFILADSRFDELSDQVTSYTMIGWELVSFEDVPNGYFSVALVYELAPGEKAAPHPDDPTVVV